MIVLRNIKKSFGPHVALNGLSLDLAAAQTHVILGASGCGKSTLLRLIIGTLTADSGEISIRGILQNTQNQAQLAKIMGYVIQDLGLFPHLNCRDNVLLPAKLAKWPVSQMHAQLHELQQLVGLESTLLTKYPQQLSGGQRQRLALMRALILNPDILLLDEPLSALDPLIRAELQDELKRIFNHLKKTVVLVTHDIAEAAYFGHTVTLLDAGKLVQHGDFSQLVKYPASPFVTRFIQAQRFYLENA